MATRAWWWLGSVALVACTAGASGTPPARPVATAPAGGAATPRRCILDPGAAGDRTAESIAVYARTLQENWDAAGVLLTERDGHVLLQQTYGAADRDSGAPVTLDTQFAIGSLTKEWTAWLVREAALAGTLPLESTLGRWLPDVIAWKNVTIEQLLEHRAGLVRTAEGVVEAANPAEATERCTRAPLLFVPGTREADSNCGYEVLARVLEIAMGRSFPEILEQRLLRPHGMSASGLGAAPRLARGYKREHAKTVAAGTVRSTGGAGGGFSTAGDLCQFLLAQDEQEQALARAGAAARPAEAASAVHGQAGKTDGFLSFLVSDRQAKLGVVYLLSQEGAPMQRVFEDLKKLAVGKFAEAPRVEKRRVIARDRRREEALLGAFQVDIDHAQHLTIERRGNQLVLIDPEGQVSALVWVGSRLLAPVALDDAGSEVSSDLELALPDGDGPVGRVELRVAGGMVLKASRVVGRAPGGK